MKEAVKQAGWTAPFCGKHLDFCNFDRDNLKFTFFPGRPNIQRTQRCLKYRLNFFRAELIPSTKYSDKLCWLLQSKETRKLQIQKCWRPRRLITVGKPPSKMALESVQKIANATIVAAAILVKNAKHKQLWHFPPIKGISLYDRSDALFNDGKSLGLMDVFPIIVIAYRHSLCRLSVYARVADLFPLFLL